MSPTAAMNVAAVCTLTPGTVINRRTSGQSSACLAISRSIAAISCSRKSTWRRHPSSVRRSSTGSSSPASHSRPALPNVSVTGARSQRLRESTPCASFLARVRARTIRSRRLVSRRSTRVRSSGVHTGSSRPDISSLASVCASRRSVLAFASEIERSLRVFATTTRIPCRCSTPTMRSAPAVASSATTSSRPRLRANSSTTGTRVAIRPAERTRPFSAIATSQKSRWTSNPSPRTTLLSSLSGRAAGHTTRTDSCSQHIGASRRGGHEQRRARSSSVRTACPTASPKGPISPSQKDSRQGRTAVSSPDNGQQFTGRFSRGGEVLFDKICRRNGIAHRLTAPRSPTTTGKIERFHQTLRRELLDDARPFVSILEAQAAIDDWVRDYNATRPHQALKLRAPVTPAERFQPGALEERELLPLWLPASLSAVRGPQVTASPERAVDAGAEANVIEAGPVEFDRVVPPSGNLMVCQRQFWLGPARAGQTVRFWASVDVIHLTINGARVDAGAVDG